MATDQRPSDFSGTDAAEPPGSEADRAEQAHPVDDVIDEEPTTDAERLVPTEDDA
jgi:hypothetical protein